MVYARAYFERDDMTLCKGTSNVAQFTLTK